MGATIWEYENVRAHMVRVMRDSINKRRQEMVIISVLCLLWLIILFVAISFVKHFYHFTR